MNSPIPFSSNRQDAPAYWQVDILWLLLATGEQTGGTYSLIEEFCPKNSGPPPHYHDQDEAFHVLEGEITFQAGDRTLKAADPQPSCRHSLFSSKPFILLTRSTLNAD